MIDNHFIIFKKKRFVLILSFFFVYLIKKHKTPHTNKQTHPPTQTAQCYLHFDRVSLQSEDRLHRRMQNKKCSKKLSNLLKSLLC